MAGIIATVETQINVCWGWIPRIFDGFEKKYTEKMFDYNFFNLEHKKLYPHLIQLFNEKKNCINCFLHQECTYGGRDWYLGETWSIGLEDSLRYDEKIKLDKKRRLGRV